MSILRLALREGARAIVAPLSDGRASGLIRPTVAALYLTGFCNSRCTMCDFWRNDRDPLELPGEQWGIAFSRLKAFGVEFVGVNASGEMFTRRDALEVLRHLRDLDLAFGVNSNGTLFTRRASKALASLAPTQVTIGIDGAGEEAYVATRGLRGGFARVLRNIGHLQDAGVRNIYLGTVLMSENVGQWGELAELAVRLGLAGIRYTAFHSSYFGNGRSGESSYSGQAFLDVARAEIGRLIEMKRKTGIVKNSEAYLRRVVEYYENPRGYFPVPCLQGSNRIEVDVYGNVTLCSFMNEPLGNLVSQEMEEIWASKRHRKARDDAYYGRCARCFLSCYAEENLRLSRAAVLPTLGDSLRRAGRLVGMGR